MMKKTLMTLGLAALLAPTAPGHLYAEPDDLVVEEKSSVIAFEAEAYTSQNGYTRVARTDASGGAVMRADGGSDSRLNFRFTARQSGTWYIWIRNHATGDLNNGMYLYLNSQPLRAPASHPLAGAVDIYLPKVGWNWQPQWLRGHSHSGPVTMNISAGTHTLSIAKRKVENPLIDKIVLTRTATPPTGFGPSGVDADAYEPDNSRTAAKRIRNGQTQRRSIHAAGNVDWAKFTVGSAGARNVRIETAGAAGDTEIWLYRSNGRQVAYNDNGGSRRFSRITVRSLPAGTYYVKVQEKGNNGTIAAYTLKASWTVAPILADAYEPDNTRLTARTIRNGQTQNRTIHAAGNLDWAKFTVGSRGARNVRIETSGSAGDTELFLYNRAGRRLNYDDNSGRGAFSRIQVATLPAGTYYIRVQEKGNNGRIAAYQLKANWTSP
jgi:hypothetical protein